ncbi:MAG TPA: response regulator [Polyangia bacterium]|jgi:CheY-like chemotaxis protein|nr:response regulator [Polyangia bacterium]
MRASTLFGVLIVEDHDDTRGLLAELLMHEGYHSIMAANGQEALARLAYVRPDVIVTDLEMPVMDGVELVRSLAKTPAAKSIPVIVLSSLDEDAARLKLHDVASHVRVFLTKPFALSTLLEAIAGCVTEPGARP